MIIVSFTLQYNQEHFLPYTFFLHASMQLPNLTHTNKQPSCVENSLWIVPAHNDLWCLHLLLRLSEINHQNIFTFWSLLISCLHYLLLFFPPTAAIAEAMSIFSDAAVPAEAVYITPGWIATDLAEIWHARGVMLSPALLRSPCFFFHAAISCPSFWWSIWCYGE
jgi:hypothetical protein